MAAGREARARHSRIRAAGRSRMAIHQRAMGGHRSRGRGQQLGRAMSRHLVIPGRGDSCPRCGKATQIREHRAITDRELRRPFYYERWFYCRNPRCRTTTIVPDRFRVINVGPEVQHRLAQIAEQLSLSPFVEPRDLGRSRRRS
jgi:hypothetical protein